MSGLANNTNAARDDGLRFFFVHLMKTGGTSFAFQLQRQFDSNEVYPSKGADRGDEADIAGYVSVSRLLRLSPERRAAIRVYTGHFPFVASELLDLDLVTMTLLRDPVERTISVLKHFKRLSRRYHSHELDDIYADPFVFAHFIENHQTRMFSVTADDKPEAFGSNMSYWATASLLGLGKPPSDDDEVRDEIDRERAVAAAESSIVDESRFKVAIEHLEKVDVIGFTEHYDAFIAELRERFGWWPAGLDTKGKANLSREGWDVSPGLRDRIAADNAYDVELYRHARELVEQRGRQRPALASSPRAVPASGAERSAPNKSAAKKPAANKPAANKPAAKKPAGPAAARGSGKTDAGRELRMRVRDGVRAKHPPFFEALLADARVTALYRSERADFRGRADGLLQAVRLMCVSDAFLAQALYRAKARLQGLGVPVLPAVAHRLAMMTAQVCIGDPVVVRPGVYLAHGQVVIDGFVEIHRGAVIFPWVTIGLRAGDVRGPTIGNDVHIGTGAKVIGPVTLHHGARVGANAVVLDDVPPDTTVVGAPARPVRDVAAP
jgi:serine O-acetyltransferase